uniref:GtrA domain-containing protein n=1 Tax=Heterorhabditis bacteriophora TaxID=37862 RepID=A0A1I7WE58_HETBA
MAYVKRFYFCTISGEFTRTNVFLSSLVLWYQRALVAANPLGSNKTAHIYISFSLVAGAWFITSTLHYLTYTNIISSLIPPAVLCITNFVCSSTLIILHRWNTKYRIRADLSLNEKFQVDFLFFKNYTQYIDINLRKKYNSNS